MPTTIPALPAAPLVSDSIAAFNTKAFAFNAALDPWGTATNTVATEVATSATTATTQAGIATTQAGTATTQAGTATTQAIAAANSATSALTAPGTSATSTTSLTVSAGSKSLTIQTGKAYSAGQTVLIADTALPATNWMFGQITSYNSATGALVVTVITIAGSGTITSWTVSLSGNPGAVLPTQTGQAGKFLKTDGTAALWGFAGISQVTVATTATTLTNTPTLLQITPAAYGVTVTLPDATTCSLGGPLFCIDNRGAYPVRVVNSAGTLLGFVFAGVVSYIGLDNNTTAAGVWAIENSELVGASAQLLTVNIQKGLKSIDLGSGRELILGGVVGVSLYGCVYDKTTNTFGTPTLIRSASINYNVDDNQIAAVLSAANQVLVVSCVTGGTTFEAVTLSISGTTITVNTAATATLSAAISSFADGCGLIAVGSSFVTSYTVATPAAQIRALSVSGTTVTIGSASTLSGTAGGLIAASGSYVIAVSTATTNLFTTPYLVSGSTLALGTGTTTAGGTMTPNKLAALGTRWFVAYNDGGSTLKGGIISLTATGSGTTTISAVTLMSAGAIQDAIVVGTSKVLVLSNPTSLNANILTDTAGTASAGTAITLGGGSTTSVLFASGTDVYAAGYTSGLVPMLHKVSCSGASPVLTTSYMTGTGPNNVPIGFVSGSNSVLSKHPAKVVGSNSAHYLSGADTTSSAATGLRFSFLGGPINHRVGSTVSEAAAQPTGNTFYRGRVQSEAWFADGSSVITKLECAA